jgi:hypothetical protein
MFRMRCCNQHRGREVLIPLFVSFLQASWNWLLIFSARDRCMAYNQNGILNRSDHKRTSYPRFVLVSETECGDWLIKLVANPELGKAAFGWVHFNWCESVSHLAAFFRVAQRQ